jgi:N-methylhydantoinase B/oxoprolinase/acetone carboxylase alpha subunit
LEIYRALFTSVAEEMGVALRRTAFSPNIKERRDYSCADRCRWLSPRRSLKLIS